MPIRIAGAQIPITTNISANVEALTRAITFAKDRQADILLTPEGSLSGYTHEFDVHEMQEALEHITTMAQQANVGLALGTCAIEDDGKCYNQLRLYAVNGDYLGFHSKTLTCGTWDAPAQGEINHFAVTPLRTFEVNGIRVGGLICNDMWANPGCTPVPDPHLSQQLSRMGTKIIFHAVNGGRDGSEWSQVNWNFHESNLRMRAQAGKVWIVTVDNCHPPHIPSSAPSGIIDPDGNWVCKTEPVGEQYFIHTIDLP